MDIVACRVRLRRESPSTGSFDWAILDTNGITVDSGTTPHRSPSERGACEVIVASDVVVLKTVKVVAAQQRHVSNALRYLIEDSVMSDPEQLHVVATSASKDSLAVAVVDRKWLEQALALLAEYGLAARNAYPECLLLPRPSPSVWTAVLDGDRGFLQVSESLGYGLEGFDETTPPTSLRLALEQARGQPNPPTALVLRAARGTVVPSCEKWSASLELPVEWTSDWSWTDQHGLPPIDLLRGEFFPHLGNQAWGRAVRRSTALVGALLLINLCGMTVDLAARVHERRKLLLEMQDIYRRTFGQEATVLDPPLQMKRGLAELRHQAGELTAGDFVPLFSKVADYLLDPSKHRIESISYSDGALTLTVMPLQASKFSEVYAELQRKTVQSGLHIEFQAREVTGGFLLHVSWISDHRT